MNRDKEVSDLIDQLAIVCDNKREEDCDEKTCYRCQAEFLIDAGYRKADEVRKETARKFKQTMKDIFRFVLRNKGNTSIPYFNAEELVFAKFDKEVDREFLQEYGVEVDE